MISDRTRQFYRRQAQQQAAAPRKSTVVVEVLSVTGNSVTVKMNGKQLEAPVPKLTNVALIVGRNARMEIENDVAMITGGY